MVRGSSVAYLSLTFPAKVKIVSWMREKPSGDWMLNRVTLKSSVVAQKFIQILLRSALKKQWKWMRTSTAVPTSICSVCTGSNSAGDFEFESKLTRLHSNAWRLLWIDSVANLRKHNCLLIRLLESRQKKKFERPIVCSGSRQICVCFNF